MSTREEAGAPTPAQALLEAALAQSGLSVTALAHQLGVDGRLARRWREGTKAIPPEALAALRVLAGEVDSGRG